MCVIIFLMSAVCVIIFLLSVVCVHVSYFFICQPCVCHLIPPVSHVCVILFHLSVVCVSSYSISLPRVCHLIPPVCRVCVILFHQSAMRVSSYSTCLPCVCMCHIFPSVCHACVILFHLSAVCVSSYSTCLPCVCECVILFHLCAVLHSDNRPPHLVTVDKWLSNPRALHSGLWPVRLLAGGSCARSALQLGTARLCHHRRQTEDVGYFGTCCSACCRLPPVSFLLLALCRSLLVAGLSFHCHLIFTDWIVLLPVGVLNNAVVLKEIIVFLLLIEFFSHSVCSTASDIWLINAWLNRCRSST